MWGSERVRSQLLDVALARIKKFVHVGSTGRLMDSVAAAAVRNLGEVEESGFYKAGERSRTISWIGLEGEGLGGGVISRFLANAGRPSWVGACECAPAPYFHGPPSYLPLTPSPVQTALHFNLSTVLPPSLAGSKQQSPVEEAVSALDRQQHKYMQGAYRLGQRSGREVGRCPAATAATLQPWDPLQQPQSQQ